MIERRCEEVQLRQAEIIIKNRDKEDKPRHLTEVRAVIYSQASKRSEELL